MKIRASSQSFLLKLRSSSFGANKGSLCGFEKRFHGQTSWQISQPNIQFSMSFLNWFGMLSFNSMVKWEIHLLLSITLLLGEWLLGDSRSSINQSIKLKFIWREGQPLLPGHTTHRRLRHGYQGFTSPPQISSFRPIIFLVNEWFPCHPSQRSRWKLDQGISVECIVSSLVVTTNLDDRSAGSRLVNALVFHRQYGNICIHCLVFHQTG